MFIKFGKILRNSESVGDREAEADVPFLGEQVESNWFVGICVMLMLVLGRSTKISVSARIFPSRKLKPSWRCGRRPSCIEISTSEAFAWNGRALMVAFLLLAKLSVKFSHQEKSSEDLQASD
jgi:hypothetical protein